MTLLKMVGQWVARLACRYLRSGIIVSQQQEYNDKELLNSSMKILNDREKIIIARRLSENPVTQNMKNIKL